MRIIRDEDIESIVSSIRSRYHVRLDSMHADIGTYSSGNWGHIGKKGMVGGSDPGGGAKNRGAKLKDGTYTSAAKERKQAEKEERAKKKEEKAKAEQKEAEMDEKKRKIEEHDKRRAYVQEEGKKIQNRETEARLAILDARQQLRLDPDDEKTKERLNALVKEDQELRDKVRGLFKEAGCESPTEGMLLASSVGYNPVSKRETPLSEEEIIKTISGGDKTGGSCASVALAYAGQKKGLDVLDFRGGESKEFFSRKDYNHRMLIDAGVDTIEGDDSHYSNDNALALLKRLEKGKQYYFVAGEHCAIVRLNGKKTEYLELQGRYPEQNGWQNFGNKKHTLSTRFGSEHDFELGDASAYMADISQFTPEKLEKILAYINTDAQEQQKGVEGYAK